MPGKLISEDKVLRMALLDICGVFALYATVIGVVLWLLWLFWNLVVHFTA